MRRTWVFLAAAVFVLASTGVLVAARRGASRGKVLETEAWKTDDGRLMLSVSIRNDERKRQTFSVGPDNREAYATVGALKKGQPVSIGWIAEGDRLWIREIGVHDEEGGDRERRERGEREERKREEHRRGERTEREGGNIEAHIRELEHALDKLRDQINELKEQIKRSQRRRERDRERD